LCEPTSTFRRPDWCTIISSKTGKKMPRKIPQLKLPYKSFFLSRQALPSVINHPKRTLSRGAGGLDYQHRSQHAD
jgi:hypothetical protein